MRSAGTPTTSATRAVIAPWQCDACGAGETRHARASTTMSARIPSSLRSPIPSTGSSSRPQPFVDLIDANLQDQRVDTYEDWPALRGYCMLSAAPVGRIVLRLFDINEEAAVPLSDDVCIGLQLANFAQDVSVDKRLGRTYLLQSDIRNRGIERRNSVDVRARTRAPRVGSSTRGDGTTAFAPSTRPLSPRRQCHPRRGRRRGIPHSNAPPKRRPRSARSNRRESARSDASDEGYAL